MELNEANKILRNAKTIFAIEGVTVPSRLETDGMMVLLGQLNAKEYITKRLKAPPQLRSQKPITPLFIRTLEILMEKPSGAPASIADIHARLCGDLTADAGKFRTNDKARSGNAYVDPRLIPGSVKNLSDKMRAIKSSPEISKTEFTVYITHYMREFIILCPFAEYSNIALHVYFGVFAAEHGFALDYHRAAPETIRASEAAAFNSDDVRELYAALLPCVSYEWKTSREKAAHQASKKPAQKKADKPTEQKSSAPIEVIPINEEEDSQNNLLSEAEPKAQAVNRETAKDSSQESAQPPQKDEIAKPQADDSIDNKINATSAKFTQTNINDESAATNQSVKPQAIAQTTETVKPQANTQATETVKPQASAQATETVKPQASAQATQTTTQASASKENSQNNKSEQNISQTAAPNKPKEDAQSKLARQLEETKRTTAVNNVNKHKKDRKQKLLPPPDDHTILVDELYIEDVPVVPKDKRKRVKQKPTDGKIPPDVQKRANKLKQKIEKLSAQLNNLIKPYDKK